MLHPDPLADLRSDAFELFQVEAARVRLHERSGSVRVVLRSGVTLSGRLLARRGEDAHGLLALATAESQVMLVNVDAITSMVGASAVLRDESGSAALPSLAHRLRECWAAGDPLRVLLRDGRWVGGDVVLVAADHIELLDDGERWVIPYRAADAWDVGSVVVDI